MRAHLKECPHAKHLSSSCENLDEMAEQRIQTLENDINTLRTVLNEEIRQRLHLITDLGNVRKQNQLQDEMSHSVQESLKHLQNRLNEENTQRCYEVEQCQQDFRYCHDIVQVR